jgi:MYXO-CTERM domain-containing protein
MLVALLTLAPGGAGAQTEIQVDVNDVATAEFMGFGAEWDSADYEESGVTEQDFELAARRIRWMKTPVVRVMMLTKWALVADDQFDFETQEMHDLYRHLDLCRDEGITVVLADWGCEQGWTAAPGIQDTADPKYAEAIGTYLDHLVNTRGYSTIEYLIVVNEPNYEVGDFGRWKTGIENVQGELVARGLDQQIALLGPDHSNADSWMYQAVDELGQVLGGYDVHRYANDSDVRAGTLESYFRDQWSYALANDSAANSKPFVVGEAGMNTGANHPVGNANIDDYVYGLWMADYGVQAAAAGSHAILAWMMDDNGHQNFYWGLWTNAAAGQQLRPWFYPWSLLTRYAPAGSTVFRVASPSADLRALALRSALDQWTFVVVNRAAVGEDVRVIAPDAAVADFQLFEYSQLSAEVDGDGFPVPIDSVSLAPEIGVEMTVPGEGVIIATSVDPDAAPGGAGGSGGAGASGGAGGSGTAATGGGGGTSAPASSPPSDDESGCGCATPGARRSARSIWALVALALVLCTRRRRRNGSDRQERPRFRHHVAQDTWCQPGRRSRTTRLDDPHRKLDE